MSCPFPEKIRHASSGAAWAAIAQLKRDGKGSPDMDAYPCGDHWHVGHSVVKFSKRIRKAVRAGNKASGRVYRRGRRTWPTR